MSQLSKGECRCLRYFHDIILILRTIFVIFILLR